VNRPNVVALSSLKRAFILASLNPALISRLSVSMIASRCQRRAVAEPAGGLVTGDELRDGRRCVRVEVRMI
jgi:hypothetical protein